MTSRWYNGVNTTCYDGLLAERQSELIKQSAGTHEVSCSKLHTLDGAASAALDENLQKQISPCPEDIAVSQGVMLTLAEKSRASKMLGLFRSNCTSTPACY